MKVTMRDVAQAAGVSTMAVSVVLSGSGNKRVSVSPETAERIRRAAQELRYRPNHLARSLKTQKTHQIAVVFQHFCGIGPENPYHIQVLQGVTSALFPKGYAMTLCPRMILDGDANLMSDGRFDGVLWCRPEFDAESLDAIKCASVPVVMMHVPNGMAPNIPTFCADNDGAMRQVVAHLKSLGHRRIAFVIDPISVKSVEGAIRREALKAAAEKAGMPTPELIVLEQDHSVLAQYAGPGALHTALVCFSDELACHVLKSCVRYEVRVPDDVSVVGFDSSPFCETTKPRLTSVSQPVDRMANAATTHLLSLIEEAEKGLPRSPMTCCLYDCGLDVRDSTAPPSTHRRV
ncbi:MAG: hypothetical protein BGO01_12250 [Armatimonadetes bacterium 55-13]|nr:LacI family DNA-binding transcriptional regulator [Armatimonadota bacterium]OJU63555.1 MAG: hypothetical protein BGO01_12250 [Armatimonadetes bacterium 55-13]